MVFHAHEQGKSSEQPHSSILHSRKSLSRDPEHVLSTLLTGTGAVGGLRPGGAGERVAARL